jgi:hypothetical protein
LFSHQFKRLAFRALALDSGAAMLAACGTSGGAAGVGAAQTDIQSTSKAGEVLNGGGAPVNGGTLKPVHGR